MSPTDTPPQRHDEFAWRSTSSTSRATKLIPTFDMNSATAAAHLPIPGFYQQQHDTNNNSSNTFTFPMTIPSLGRESSNSNTSSSGVATKPLLLPRLLPRLNTDNSDSNSGAMQMKLAPLAAFLGSPTEPSMMTMTPSAHTAGSVVGPVTGTAQTLVSILQQAAATSTVAAARMTSTSHKRGFSSDEDGYGSPRHAWGSHSEQHQAHKKSKSRKPTYLVRKEEKDLLIEQVSKLQAHVDFLRERSGIVDWQSKDKQLQEKEIVNNVLRETVRNQQFSFFSAQSVVSELMTSGQRCPIDTHIHLGKDWAQRRETLVALKAQKLHDAQRLLEKRTQFIDPTRELNEETSFVAENGDFCAISFQSVPLKGTKSVKHVYDALHFHTQNMERSIAEAMGTVLTSDGDDNWDKTILHRRLVHSNVRDVLTESNFVVFSEFYDGCRKGQWSKEHNGEAAGKELGVIVLDFVDEDELYPYRSHQCMRQDVTAVITLKAVPSKPRCSKPTDNSLGAQGLNPQEYTVVITRWSMLKLRHNSAISVSDLKMQELKAQMGAISKALVRAVQDSSV